MVLKMFKKGKSEKPAKKGGGLFGSGKKSKGNTQQNQPFDEVSMVESGIEQQDDFSLKKPNKKNKSKGKSAGFDINKLDIKKTITILVVVLVILILLLVAKIMMGGDDAQVSVSDAPPPAENTSEPVPVIEPAQPTTPDMPAVSEPAPTPEAPISPPANPEPAVAVDMPVAPPTVAEPVQVQEVPVPPPAPATPPPQPVQQVQPTQPQPVQQKPANSGGSVSADELDSLLNQRIYRERNTAPPTSTN